MIDEVSEKYLYSTQMFIHDPTPVTIALPYAESLVVNGNLDSFDIHDDEHEALRCLEEQAEAIGALNQQFFVTSGRSILTSLQTEENYCTSFDSLDFSGELFTYSTVRIGRTLGNHAMRALCLSFHNVTLLPYFDRIAEDQLLHVPAYAVHEMDPVSI